MTALQSAQTNSSQGSSSQGSSSQGSSSQGSSSQGNSANAKQESQYLLSYLLALSHIPGVGLAKIKAILNTYGTPEKFFLDKGYNNPRLKLTTQAIEYAAHFFTPGSDGYLNKKVASDLQWLERENANILTVFDKAYPQYLKNIHNPPVILYALGNVDLLSKTQIGMVGSRSPTVEGLKNATGFADMLSRSGVIVTSGLAIGIDGAAHQGALKAQNTYGHSAQPTIAVLANGLDQIYPRRHAKLAVDIIKNGGVLVSEHPVGTAPQAKNFPRRNRIISGLSVGVLVVEAAIKSGSLITARYANEQGREVFAIPGSIHSAQSRGVHQLIRQGAKLVESVTDILDELPYAFSEATPTVDASADNTSANAHNHHDETSQTSQNTSPKKQQHQDDLTESERLVVETLTQDPKPIDQIVSDTHMNVRQVTALLSLLEVKGLVKNIPGGYCIQ